MRTTVKTKESKNTSCAPRTVLVADDDAISGRILEKNLKDWGFRVLLAHNGDEAWRAIQKPGVRIALLDWMMPGIDGAELCRRTRDEKKAHYTFIVLLTGRDTPSDIIGGLEAGADDYMIKPVNFLELRARLKTGLRIIDLEDKLLDIQRRLTELATKDSLTGLWNRSTVIKFLEDELAHATRDAYPLSVIMADVDYFKKINDTGGHHVGDRVLRNLAGCFSRHVRPYDKVGRYGGDEVLMVLPNCGLRHVAEIAERLRRTCAKRTVRVNGDVLPLTLSIGCTSSECYIRPTADKMIRASDRALYQAKDAGRNLVALSHALSRTKKERQRQEISQREDFADKTESLAGT